MARCASAPEGRYEGRYAEGELKKDVWVYFNNDLEGHAVRDAQLLRELLE